MRRMGLLWAILIACTVGAQESGRSYPDGHGGEVFFPMGEASFADELVSFTAGNPARKGTPNPPEVTLGAPDYPDRGGEGALTLGCGGELVLAFTDNALIDVPGPDLYVFEIGPDTEPTAMAVSPDGADWTRVGRISGGKAEVDIAPYTDAEVDYRYVKLVDLKQACRSRTPGADLDAVGALGSASRIALDSSVLFDSGAHRLKPGAFEALDDALARIGDPDTTRVEVAGHTDAVGSKAANQALSRRRARSVADYLLEQGGFPASAVTTRAYGEARPVASNDTAEGRQRNRQVELTVRTTASAERSGDTVTILGLWETRSHGILEFQREGDNVTASYTSDGGALLGRFTSETVFEGYWVENDSRRTCDSRKDGREHWGPIRLEFETPELDHFKGAWGYCGDPADNHSWRGKRLL